MTVTEYKGRRGHNPERASEREREDEVCEAVAVTAARDRDYKPWIT